MIECKNNKEYGDEELIKQRELKKKATIKSFKINRKKVYIIKSKQPSEEEIKILYFHGGAYLGGITKYHWDFIDEIFKKTNATIIFPDYPLTPKNTYKEVHKFAEELYKKVADENLIIMGDSAGGGITLALCEKMKIEGYMQPKRIILISPWLDITLKNEKIDEIQHYDKVLNKIALKLAAEVYCGRENPDSYLTSPINGPIEGLNNIMIFTGTYDILNPDVHVFEKRFEKGNIQVFERDKAAHNWIIEDIENSREDFEKLIDFIKE